MELSAIQSGILFGGLFLGGVIVLYTLYGLFTLAMHWIERQHPEIFRKYLPQYLEEEEPR